MSIFFFGLLPTFFEIPPQYMDAFGHIVEADMMNWFVTRVAEGDADIRKYWASLTHVVALAQKNGRLKICKQIEMKRDLANAAIAAIGMNETIVDLCKEVIAMRHSLWSYKHPDDKKQTTWYDTMICQIKEYDPEYQAPVFTVWHAPCVSIGSPSSPYLSAGD